MPENLERIAYLGRLRDQMVLLKMEHAQKKEERLRHKSVPHLSFIEGACNNLRAPKRLEGAPELEARLKSWSGSDA